MVCRWPAPGRGRLDGGHDRVGRGRQWPGRGLERRGRGGGEGDEPLPVAGCGLRQQDQHHRRDGVRDDRARVAGGGRVPHVERPGRDAAEPAQPGRPPVGAFPVSGQRRVCGDRDEQGDVHDRGE